MLATTAIVATFLTAAELDFLVLPDRPKTFVTPVGTPDASNRCRVSARGEYRVSPNYWREDPTNPMIALSSAYFLNEVTVDVLMNGKVISTQVHPSPLKSVGDWGAGDIETDVAPTDQLSIRLTLVGNRVMTQHGPGKAIRDLADEPVRRVKVIPLPNPRTVR